MGTHSNTLAPLDSSAGIDNVLVVLSLLLDLLGITRSLETDIELSDGNIDLQLIGPPLPDGDHGVRELAEDQMALSTNAIDRDTLGLELLDEPGNSLSLGGNGLKVVLMTVSSVTLKFVWIIIRR